MRSPDRYRMQIDLSNQVIAGISDQARPFPRRTLDLGNIFTPELGLLAPQRSEIAPRGGGRDTALIAYSDRLRQSYRTNEGGIRDGMLKLGQAFREGQTIAVSCFCRAGELCHADVVKKAIEKVGRSLSQEATRQKAHEVVEHSSHESRSNPRTERAINEILSVGRSDLILSKLEDTEGRNRSEHASYLNGRSQFVRDLYERGAVVRDGVLISPKDNASSPVPLAVSTAEYAVKKLELIVNESRAKELAPQIVDYGTKIGGKSADRDTKIKVFNWIYGALEGRNDFLRPNQNALISETKEERFDRTLNEVANLAEEMSRLEPSDMLVLLDDQSERSPANGLNKSEEELSLENIYEYALGDEEVRREMDAQSSVRTPQEFERVELENTEPSRLAADMSKEELDKWINVRLPILDEMLESGMAVEAILKPFENDIYQTAKNDPGSKQAAIDDLKFASAYLEHQLKQPESRLRHFNSRYRNYAAMLENAASRSEVMEAASKIRLENARLGLQWERMTETEKAGTPRPLTSKGMQFLFTEASPRHYTTEMTAVRLAYSNAGKAARSKTDALMRGEIEPSTEALQLIDSLESRMERRDLKDSLSGTKHFLQSLKTPNDELRYKNSFDHSELYQKLPPAERDFVYQRATQQKEKLVDRLEGKDHEGQLAGEPVLSIHAHQQQNFTAFRDIVEAGVIQIVKQNPDNTKTDLVKQIDGIIRSGLERSDSPAVINSKAVLGLSSDLAERIGQHLASSEYSRNPASKDAVRVRSDNLKSYDSPIR